MNHDHNASVNPDIVVTPRTAARRRLLAALGGAGGALLVADRWVPPLIRSAALPVHAQTTGEVELLNGDFGGDSSTPETLGQANPLLDLLAPRAFAGGIAITTTVEICADVVDGVADVIISFNDTNPGTLTGSGPVPGNIPLSISGNTDLSNASLQVDTADAQELTGSFLVTSDAGATNWVFPFSIQSGGPCTFNPV